MSPKAHAFFCTYQAVVFHRLSMSNVFSIRLRTLKTGSKNKTITVNTTVLVVSIKMI